MPFALIITGLTLLVSGVRGTNGDLYKLVRGEFSSQANFGYWILAILLIGSLGYIQDLQKLSRAFLVLVIVGLFVKNGTGFFDSFSRQVLPKK